jgi:hypothetical protein
MAVQVRWKGAAVHYGGNVANGSSAAVTTASSVEATDLLVAFCFSDYVLETATLSANPGSWNVHRVQNGTSGSEYTARAMVASRPAGVSGAQTVTADINNGGAVYLQLYVLSGADHDGASAVNSTTAVAASTACHAVPAVRPGVAMAGFAMRYLGVTLTRTGFTGGTGNAITEGRYLQQTSTLGDFALSVYQIQGAGYTPSYTVTASQATYWCNVSAFFPESDDPPPAPEPQSTTRAAMRAAAFWV